MKVRYVLLKSRCLVDFHTSRSSGKWPVISFTACRVIARLQVVPCLAFCFFRSHIPLYASDCDIAVNCAPVRSKLGCISRLGSSYSSLVAPCLARFLASWCPFSVFSFASFRKHVIPPLFLSAAIIALRISLLRIPIYPVCSHFPTSPNIPSRAHADVDIIVRSF